MVTGFANEGIYGLSAGFTAASDHYDCSLGVHT